jgi:hypothetical protein
MTVRTFTAPVTTPPVGVNYFTMDLSAGAVPQAGWTTAQNVNYFTRTHVPAGGPTGGGAYDLQQVVGAGGDNYYGWSRREVASVIATAGQVRFYRWRMKFLAGTNFGGGSIVNKILIPHDSQNGNNERAICQYNANSSTTEWAFQHDGGSSKVAIGGSTIPTQIDAWMYFQWEIKYSSAFGVADGYWKIWKDSAVYASPILTNLSIIQNVPSGANNNLMRMGYVNSGLASGAHGFRIAGVEVGTAFDVNWHG